MEDLYKKLFELVSAKGEILEGDLHILDHTDDIYPDDEDYRVYHKDGYCFNIKKDVSSYEEEGGTKYEIEYFFNPEWDGFKELTVNKAIELCS